jgi:hypothetical protein
MNLMNSVLYLSVYLDLDQKEGSKLVVASTWHAHGAFPVSAQTGQAVLENRLIHKQKLHLVPGYHCRILLLGMAMPESWHLTDEMKELSSVGSARS